MNQKVNIGIDTFEVVPTFKYLGDTVGHCSRGSATVSTRIISTWKAFRKSLPILINGAIQFKLRGNVFNSCVRKVLVYGCKSWAVLNEDLQ